MNAPIIPEHRKSLTRRQRVKIFDATGGTCHLCGLKIRFGEKWQADHIIPLEISGKDGATYMAPAHVECHKEKTREDQKQIARAYRVRAKHLGIKSRKGPPMPGSRASKWRKTFNRGWVLR